MTYLNISAMLTGDVVRMRYVRRFNTCRVIGTETVAEHVAFTAIYALMVGLWVERVDDDINVSFGKLLTRALLHDIEETKTGDFPRPYKYGDEGLLAALDASAKRAATAVFAEMELHPDDRAKLLSYWENAKDGTIEGKILAFADFLSAVSFIAQEVIAGNKTMKEHTKTCTAFLGKFSGPEFDFIRPLVQQAAAVVHEVFA